jgi:hypothetical protein
LTFFYPVDSSLAKARYHLIYLDSRGAGSNVKRRGQPFQKGLASQPSFFWAAIFVKTLLYGYPITCGYYGSANFDINLNNFIRCTVLREWSLLMGRGWGGKWGK